ncbi:cupredoxin domain-containing protein [Halorussus salinisoli]|uniref:cupredoxin domain-containing protein n=1 Tax=Halorussus salinisoli TaxID=2558242 RepID=UPI0010C20722|nr:hypothetical protein [Halorussus salinisoli]
MLDTVCPFMVRATIEITDDGFEPVREAVSPGTTVVWQNGGTADYAIRSVRFHDVAVDWQFRTQTFQPGDSAVYTFDEEGIYEYYGGSRGENVCGVVLVGDSRCPTHFPASNETGPPTPWSG